ncbi:MAG: hypothetical protein AUG51_10265 [Acidobacteria bacterium 13_1_20CM_3_53_8]|nr:MAG: hypothetical protein AUG51_10265 [Acidobacteria bacterium 13_1_20CM_3_53_8]
MSSSEKSFVRDDELTTRVIAGETLVVPVRGRVGDLDSIYTLNEVASRIWQLIGEGFTVRRIVEIIGDEFEVESVEAERDVSELLASMEEAGLIRALKG